MGLQGVPDRKKRIFGKRFEGTDGDITVKLEGGDQPSRLGDLDRQRSLNRIHLQSRLDRLTIFSRQLRCWRTSTAAEAQ